MKPFISLLAAYLCFSIVASAQAVNIPIDRPIVRVIDSIESESYGQAATMDGVNFKIPDEYFPKRSSFKLAQPILSTRQTRPLRTQVNYYYSLPDSVVRLVEFTWDTPAETKDKLNTVYTANCNHFNELMGVKPKISEEEKDDTWQETIIWENKTTWVKQFILRGPANRVRVMIAWK